MTGRKRHRGVQPSPATFARRENLLPCAEADEKYGCSTEDRRESDLASAEGLDSIRSADQLPPVNRRSGDQRRVEPERRKQKRRKTDADPAE